MTIAVVIDPGQIEYIRLDRTLWLTSDLTRVVEDGDPEAAFLYGNPGHSVPKKEAAKLGALPLETKTVHEEVETVKEEPIKQRKPSMNKMAATPEEK